MARRIAGAAALIAALTVASRVAGFTRTLVFNWAIGPTDLGDIYLAANTVPNVIFEIVAGGALASLVVPLLAGAVARGDTAEASATTSALLTWTLTLLVPVALAVAVAARPIVAALSADGVTPEQLATGARMLRVFAPQLPLYGIGVVLTGVLQAHHRFAWPVLAPLLSSVTVIGAYLSVALVDTRGVDLATLSGPGEAILSVGTTAGVAVLSLCLLIPLRPLALTLRPRYGFPGDARAAVGKLALAGAVTVAAQQVALVVALRYALAGPEGSVVLFNLAQTVFLLPWAVLAVPVATAAYPVLARTAASGDTGGYRDTLAATTRGVLLLSFLGAAALVALAQPAARLLVAAMAPEQAARVGELTAALVGFAPGLVGYGLTAALTRALYARGDTAVAAVATVAGWVAVAGASGLFAVTLPAGRRVLALGVANSLGLTLLGAALLVAVWRRAGTGALAGLRRAGVTGVAAAGAGAAAGLAVGAFVVTLVGGDTTPAVGPAVTQGMLSGITVCVVFLALAYALDRRDIEPLLRRARRYPFRRRTPEGTDSPTGTARPESGPQGQWRPEGQWGPEGQ
jgi:putative peptidoglycan lipid II flippase